MTEPPQNLRAIIPNESLINGAIGFSKAEVTNTWRELHHQQARQKMQIRHWRLTWKLSFSVPHLPRNVTGRSYHRWASHKPKENSAGFPQLAGISKLFPFPFIIFKIWVVVILIGFVHILLRNRSIRVCLCVHFWKFNILVRVPSRCLLKWFCMYSTCM